jgi:hypothetical protein
MVWQRVSDWLPTFNTTVGDLTIRATIFGPHGKTADIPGFVYAVSFENLGTRDLVVTFTPNGVLGLRQHRIRSSAPMPDEHGFQLVDDTITLHGRSPYAGAAMAIGLDPSHGPNSAIAEQRGDGAVTWSLTQQITVPPQQHIETAIYVSVAPERDGAAAVLDVMRRRGWRRAAEDTRVALSALEQTTGVASADRLVNRHLMFAYFGSVVRAIDDARMYVVRTRLPWHSAGVTIRDWDALMWILPAVQLADPDCGRELLLRVCELHGYAPGRGVNYLDGVPFRPGFSLDGAAAYAVAIDRYISQTGDDRIVEEHIVADTLYGSYEDITARRNESVPLYATDETASGVPPGTIVGDVPQDLSVGSSEAAEEGERRGAKGGTNAGREAADAGIDELGITPLSVKEADFPYTLHANSLVAYALDVFRQILDEKTAAKVESGDVVRAAIQRHFCVEEKHRHPVLKTALDLKGDFTLVDDPVSALGWIPLYDAVPRTDTSYRRTVKLLGGATDRIAALCSRLLGPDGPSVLDQLRRATMDNGCAAEAIDAQGHAQGNGGDAALSGLVAYSVWYSVHALGVRF